MILLDTSVVVDVLRDKTGRVSERLAGLVGDDDVYLSRFTELELLQGARDEREWTVLTTFIGGQDIVEPSPSCWREAARIFFDLRRQGETVRAVVDCCVAQIALERGLTLIHDDRDFDTIGAVRPLRHRRLETGPAR